MSIQKKISELNTLQRRLEQTKIELNNLYKIIEDTLIANLNKSISDKIEVFNYNTMQLYGYNSEQIFELNKYIGVDWGRFLGNSPIIPNPYLNLAELLKTFDIIFNKEKKFKTVNKPIYQYNYETGEIIPYTDLTWQQNRRSEDFELLKKSIAAIATNTSIQEEIDISPIRRRECNLYCIRILQNNPKLSYTFDPTEMADSIIHFFRFQKEIHILHACIETAYDVCQLPCMFIKIKAGTINYSEEEIKNIQ